MTSQELKSLQGPLKEKYRNHPQDALITLKAIGRLGEGISCRVETGRKLVQAGLHQASGGTGLLACSGDMLLEALVACASVTLSAVATSLGIELKSGEVSAEGDLDFRGTLGVSKEVSVGFKTIRLEFRLESDVSREQLKSLIELTERYCVVYQTLVNATSVKVSVTNSIF